MKGILSAALGGIAKRLPQWMVSTKIVNKAAQSADIPGLTMAPPVSNLSLSDVAKLKSLSTNELSVKDLEQLAAVFYKGIDGHISKDITAAVEYWSAAGSKGSIDSLYYKALCMRKGDGIAKDTSAAFQNLMNLASEHDHSRSHVSCIVLPVSSVLSFVVCLRCNVPQRRRR